MMSMGRFATASKIHSDAVTSTTFNNTLECVRGTPKVVEEYNRRLTRTKLRVERDLVTGSVIAGQVRLHPEIYVGGDSESIRLIDMSDSVVRHLLRLV